MPLGLLLGLGGQPGFAGLALLGGSQSGRILLLQDLDAATGLFDRLARALRHAGDLEAGLGLELALAEQADAVLAAARQACGLQCVMIEQLLGVDLAGVDQLLDRAQVHLGVVLGEDVVEAALRQPHVERHLAAFEALHGDARAALLTLLAATRGLAQARTDAAADASAGLAGTGVIAEFVDLDRHVLHSLSLLSRMKPNGIAVRLRYWMN